MKDLQIIIPITGNGSRFKNAGYKQLKPLIEVDGVSMLEWVVRLFPGNENNIVLICRSQHLEEINSMRSTIYNICPNAKLIELQDWQKFGPAFDILSAEYMIDNYKPTIISYCDYFMHWDFLKFKSDLISQNCDGAIPTYTNFHPHLLPPKNLYASCKIDKNQHLIEIKEKFSWHEDKTKDFHSPGMYYFKTGSLMKKYIQKMIEAQDHINHEYYMSLPFNYMVQDGLTVWCPANVKKFCQWGTPEDLEDYQRWKDIIKRLT